MAPERTTMRIVQNSPDRFLGRAEWRKLGPGNLVRYRSIIYQVVEACYQRRMEDEVYVAFANNQYATPDYTLVSCEK